MADRSSNIISIQQHRPNGPGKTNSPAKTANQILQQPCKVIDLVRPELVSLELARPEKTTGRREKENSPFKLPMFECK